MILFLLSYIYFILSLFLFLLYFWFDQIAFHYIFSLVSPQYFSTPFNSYFFYPFLIITHLILLLFENKIRFSPTWYTVSSLINSLSLLFLFCFSRIWLLEDFYFPLMPSYSQFLGFYQTTWHVKSWTAVEFHLKYVIEEFQSWDWNGQICIFKRALWLQWRSWDKREIYFIAHIFTSFICRVYTQ